ncbi:MAG: hypothetical protein GQ559_05100 [Desulfobulbaceae bacterium]|nr:hypothetical protein [Desulfobulbaceae bacterium]
MAEEAAVSGVADNLIQLVCSVDTFYFLMSGSLVMWMAAGFTMLEAGLVRGKNTVEILTKRGEGLWPAEGPQGSLSRGRI